VEGGRGPKGAYVNWS